MSNVTDLRLYLPPSTLKGFPVDVVPADPALGGYDILIWRSAAHDDGLRVHRLPQAQRIIQTFRPQDVAVIGLHCVFEHHAAQGPVSLAAFLHEYRIGFPVAVDQPGDNGPLPVTMETYALEGTPTLLLIDRGGRLRARHFGTVSDLALGAEIMALVLEGAGPG